MALVYVAEFSSIAAVGSPGGFPSNQGQAPLAGCPPTAESTVVVGAGSLQSAVFGATTRLVRIHTDVICSIKFGTNPTAAATNMRLAANQTEYFGVSPGMRVAVITNT